LIKIAVVGSHCVGKTTLAHELVSTLTREGLAVELLKEVARDCPLPVNENASEQAFYWILGRQVQLEVEKSNYADALVCDRSVIDNYVYYVRRFGRTGQKADALSVFTRCWMKTYDLLVRLPITFLLEDDRYRSLDVGFQVEIDKLFDEIVESEYGRGTNPLYVRGPVSPLDVVKILKPFIQPRRA
jgi:nicotinamide riboside kinase